MHIYICMYIYDCVIKRLFIISMTNPVTSCSSDARC